MSGESGTIHVRPEAIRLCASRTKIIAQDLEEKKTAFLSAGSSLSGSWTCKSGEEFKATLDLIVGIMTEEASGLKKWSSALLQGGETFEASDQAIARSIGGQ